MDYESATGDTEMEDDSATGDDFERRDALVDYMGTLVPGMEPPRENDLPPELPPKQKTRPQSILNGGQERPRSPPPPPPDIPPRRKDKNKTPPVSCLYTEF